MYEMNDNASEYIWNVLTKCILECKDPVCLPQSLTEWVHGNKWKCREYVHSDR